MIEKKVRASATDRFIKCADSAIEPETVIDTDSPEARLGQAGHEALAARLSGDEPRLSKIAGRYNVDEEELEELYHRGLSAFASMGHWYDMDTVEVEQRLIGIVTEGTTDFIDVTRYDGYLVALSLGDWKTGWSMTEHPTQLLSYADCARTRYGMPESGHIRGTEIWLRHNELRTYKFTSSDLNKYQDNMHKQYALIGKQSKPGEHCTFCKRAYECKVYGEYIRGTGNAMQLAESTGLTRDDIGMLYERYRMLRQALNQYEKLLNAELQRGPLKINEKQHVRLTKQYRDGINPAMAWELLFEKFKFAGLFKFLSISKTKLMKHVGDIAEKGKGAEQKRDMLRELYKAGAIEKKVIFKKAVFDNTEFKK